MVTAWQLCDGGTRKAAMLFFVSGVPDSPFLLYGGAALGPVLVVAAVGLKLASLPKDGDEAEQKSLTAQDDSTEVP